MGNMNKLVLLNKARRNQWRSKAELEADEFKLVRWMVKEAYDNCEFYHRRYDECGVRPDDIKTFDDLQKLPIVTKQDLRLNSTTTILNRKINLARCRVTETSGSTGIPTKVVYDPLADDFSKAINLRSHVENGLGYFSKWVVFGDPRHYQEPKWFQRMGLFSPIQISVHLPLSEQVNLVRSIGPDAIGGYSSAIWMLAKYVRENAIEDIKPKAVFGTSELLSSDHRDLINDTFNLQMVDMLGCVELNRTAWECSEHMGYHMDIDAVAFEFIMNGEPVNPGERGEILYTGLYNTAMPLIRYSIGDSAILSDESCACNRGLPLLKHVEGRSDAFMIDVEGRTHPPIVWTLLMRQFLSIEQFKAIQLRRDLIRIEVVLKGELTPDLEESICIVVKKEFGALTEVQVHQVDSIKKEKSGKIRSAVSLID